MSNIDKETYCKNCKRSIYGEYNDCDINIENDGLYVKGNTPCYCKVLPDGTRAEKYSWEK